MNHPLLKGRVQPLGNLVGVIQRPHCFHWPVSQRVVFQILAVNVIHHDVVDVILIPIIKNSYNMGVAEMQQDVCLALEACQQLGVPAGAAAHQVIVHEHDAAPARRGSPGWAASRRR